MATKTMTASAKDAVMSDGQIDTLANSLRDAARKHREEAPKDVAQEALGTENLGMMMWTVFRKLVEEISRWIVHVVSVNRTRTPQQSLDACGRKQYVDKKIVNAMPRCTGDRVKLVYFKPDDSAYKDGWLSCATLAEEYKKRGLVPDPQAQIDDNAANPEFADTTPNGCQWVDADGNYCCAAFDRWDGERFVDVYRSDRGWHGHWAFAGVPQESLPSGT